MSLVKRKIFICDHCGAIKLAERYDCSFSYRLPYGWGEFGRNHLCPSCYTAYYCADTHEFLHFLEDIGERWEDSEIRKR